MKEVNPPAAVRSAEAKAISYDKAVKELEHLSRNNWRVGEIADRVEPKHGVETLQRLAAESGIEHGTVRKCRWVYQQWPESVLRRTDLPWSIHEIFAAQKDRFDLIKQKKWTAAEARALVESRKLPVIKEYITLDDWEQMKPEARAVALATEDTDKRFNDQGDNDNIEWALWSWNPVTGCRHNCPYCYARDIADRFYEQKFEPSLYPARLRAPENTPFPEAKAGKWMGHKNVFTCSMADLFGRWVPAEWIEAILAAVRAAPQWNFLFLTKFPVRMAEFDFPPNAWLGTTVDCQARVANAERSFRKVKAAVKWLSCEPLIEPLMFADIGAFDWIVLGGASPSTQTPAWHPPVRWVADLKAQAEGAGVVVYDKANLLRRQRGYPGAPDPEQSEAPDALRYLPTVEAK